MADIVNIKYAGSGIESQVYNSKDDALITSNFIYTKFGDPNDYIEMFIYDLNGNLIDSVYNMTSYNPGPGINPSTGLHNAITLDPQGDLAARGYDRGSLNVQYNFHRNLFNSSYGNFYWIKEISPSRTEIKIASQNINNTSILSGYNQYQAYIASLNYYNDFYLNFGNNKTIIAVNVAYTEDADGSYLLIKLYEPLPFDYGDKDQFWIVEKLAENVTYNVDIQVESVQTIQQNALRGPNFNVNINQQTGQSTPYYTYSSMFSTSVSSSFQKMMSYYQDKSISINVDYTNFSNFIHFSSATARINNFVEKITNIENYNSQIAQQLAIAGGITNTIVSSSIINLQNNIDDIITNFDSYEYYLYYTSGTFAWPKTNSTQPYTLYSVTSSQATNWLGSQTTLPSNTGISILYSASYYDSTNKDILSAVVPQYIQDDSNNTPYITFVNMVAQLFDNIWLYYKDVTNRFNATNNPNTGISPDLVADALINLGLTLYTNTNISDNLYYSLFGINQDGSLLPPTGSENINNYVTSSISTLAADSIQKELYKRLYHNIPYLYKTKGTRESIKALTNIFGVPDSILEINEFGGNYTYDVTKPGLDYINDNKISLPGISEISQELNPYTTLQSYDNSSYRLNSRNLEFGFSPSDEINSTIVSASLSGYAFPFIIDTYIGNPIDQYSSSYSELNDFRNFVFSDLLSSNNGLPYTHNIYEYIRLLKYYNNTLFKIVQDFVPARTNLSKGLIVKSHVLERNKYARNEPEIDSSINFSQSIETSTVTGSDGGLIQFSTYNKTSTPFKVVPLSNPSGANFSYASVNTVNNYSWEKYTGEFGGSEISANYSPFDQIDYSSYTSPVVSSNGIYPYCVDTYVKNTDSNPHTIGWHDCMGYSHTYTVGSGVTYHLGCINSGSAGGGPSYMIITDSGSCSSMFSGINYGGIYNNVSSSVKSNIINEAEYSYGINQPINLPNLISQSGCQSCFRENCYNYTLSTTTDAVSYSYQDCSTGITIYNNLDTNSNTSFCAVPNTFIIYSPTGSATWTLTTLGICGTVFSNYPYSLNCRNVIFTNNDTSLSAIVNYQDCTGSFHSLTIPPESSTTPKCIDALSISIYPLSPTTNITSSIGSYCDPPIAPITKTCYTLETINIFGNWILNYTTCDGQYVTNSGYSNNLHSEDYYVCVRSGSIYAYSDLSISVTSSNSPCGLYENLTPYTGSRMAAEVQDYNYSLQSSINSKYNGAKSISATYNVYTPGDSSYGSNPAADYYTDFTGIFTSVESSSYFPDQMVLKMGYLADISGGLEELNLQNNNWIYFQNIYKASRPVTIKQFNATQFSNQKYLDAQFNIVESGYSYPPYWYRQSGSTSECYTAQDTAIQNLFGGNASILASGLFSSLYYIPGNKPNSTIPTSMPMIPSGSFSGTGSYNNYNISLWDANQIMNDPDSLLTTFSSGSTYNYITGSYFTPPQSGIYDINSSILFQGTVGDVAPLYITSSINLTLQIISGSISSHGFIEGAVLASNSWIQTASPIHPFSGIIPPTTLSVNSNNVLLSTTDKIFIKLTARLVEPIVELYINSFSQNFSYIAGTATVCIDTTTSSHILFNTSSLSSTLDSVQLTSGMDQYFNSGLEFNPSYTSTDPSAPTSSLYSQFGDINYTTEIDPGDYIIFYYNGQDVNQPSGSIYPIKRLITTVSGLPKTLSLYPPLPGFISGSNINKYKEIVFVKRRPDETTIIVKGRKRPGETSYGFAVPENLSPNIYKNINTLQATIQSALLNY